MRPGAGICLHARPAGILPGMNHLAGQVLEALDKNERLLLAGVLNVTGAGVRVLFLNGKEATLNERQILHATREPHLRMGDHGVALEAMKRIDASRAQRADLVDLAELHAVVADESRPLALADLAGLLFAAHDEEGAAALLRRLHAHQPYFRRRLEGFVVVPPAEVAATLQREAEEARRAAEEEAAVKALKAASAAAPPVAPVAPGAPRCAPALPPPLSDLVPVLVDLAVLGEESAQHERWWPVLVKAGLGTQTKLALLLVKLGVFAPDEDILLRRHRVPTDFPAAVEEAARVVVATVVEGGGERGGQRGGERGDLTGRPGVAIDAVTTRDRDDAFSYMESADGCDLHIHIADAAAGVAAGSPLDDEARRRATTLYLPDRRIPMLPPVLSEECLSLDQHGDKPALTFRARFDREATLLGFDLVRSRVRIAQALSYDEADERLAGGDPVLAAAAAFAGRLRARRLAAGALVLPRAEVTVKALADGTVSLERRTGESASMALVEELMILTNHLAARFASERRLPFLYRRQEPPSEPLPTLARFDPVVFFRLRRVLRRSSSDLAPGLHAGLGVPAYAQVSSPLRRYADLLLSRQLLAALGHGTALSAEALQAQLLLAEQGLRVAESVMAARERYYKLKYVKLAQADGREHLEAVLADLGHHHATVWLEDLDLYADCPLPRCPATVGARVRLKVTAVDPWADLLSLAIEAAL